MNIVDADREKWWKQLPTETQQVLYDAAVEDRMDADTAKTIIDSPNFTSSAPFTQWEGSYEGSFHWPDSMRKMIVAEGVRSE